MSMSLMDSWGRRAARWDWIFRSFDDELAAIFGDMMDLRLREARTFPGGTVALTYVPA